MRALRSRPRLQGGSRQQQEERLIQRNALPTRLAIATCCTALFLALGWLGDDALFTLTSIHNLLHGFGMRLNIDERVQAYSHPGWAMLLAACIALTRESYWTTVTVSAVCSAIAVALMTPAPDPARTPLVRGVGWVALAALLSSSTFVDWTTGGLEGPLNYLLLAVLVRTIVDHDERSLSRAGVVLGLLVLNRYDAVVLGAPLWLVVAARPATWRARLLSAASATVPPALWAMVSLLYYGSMLPNTAYAKLGTGLPAETMHQQGLVYLDMTVSHDPVFGWLVVSACLILLVGRATRLGIGVALATAAQLVWIVRAGGDFMCGRLLAPIALLAYATVATGIAEAPSPRVRSPDSWLIGGIGLGVVGVLALAVRTDEHPWRFLQRGQVTTRPRGEGVNDEKSVYWNERGVGSPTGRPLPERGAVCPDASAAPVGHRMCGGAGYIAWSSCVHDHLVDTCALADPLLSRLPVDMSSNWRVGHYVRAVPAGWDETVLSGRNMLPLGDPLHDRVDEVLLVTRGPLLSPARMRVIGARLARGEL